MARAPLSRQRPPLRALVFDVDGTLAQTERDGHRVAFNLAFDELGLGWHWDSRLYGELLEVTGGKERVLHYWRSVDPQTAARADASQLVAEVHRRKTAHYLRHVESGQLRLRCGVARLLRQARRAGLLLAIATTTSEANVHALLRATLGASAPAWFACVGAGDCVPRKKPDPAIYLWVLQRLGLAADECLAFEDSAAGLRSACGAGLRTVVTPDDYTLQHDFEGAWAVLDGLGEAHASVRGRVAGREWSGVVGLRQLREWARA